MIQLDRRTMLALLAASGMWPRTALASEPGVVRVPFGLEDGRMQLPVGLNGQGPFTFMIDTGTYVSLIRPDLAKQLKLPVQGYERTRGVGGKSDSFAIYVARDVVIGNSLRQPTAVFEDSFEFGERQGVFGALAAGMLTAVDTDLDFDASELRLYPDGRGERPGFVAVESDIPRPDVVDRGSRRIWVTVALDGKPLRCVLDTGSPQPLLIGQSAAKRVGMWDGRPYAPSRPRGIGGAGPIARTMRAETLAFGGIRLERPLVTSLGSDIGGNMDGILGLSLIRRSNLSIDTRGGKLWVQPSRQPPAPERYGLSGLWLERTGAAITVAAVGKGSPAEKAGMAVGDRIMGNWEQTLRATGGKPGDSVRLQVSRGGVGREVALTLTLYL